MKNKFFNRAITALACIFLLASCGPDPEDSSSETSESEPQTYEGFAYTAVSGGYVSSPFEGADDLPQLEENEYVAFCPVSSGYTHVYCWEDDPYIEIYGSWPGTAMTLYEEDNNWYKVDYPLDSIYDSLNIIFNKNGSPQTADLLMDSPGYWWFDSQSSSMVDSAPEGAYITSASFSSTSAIKVLASYYITHFALYEEGNIIYQDDCNDTGIQISFPSDYEIDIAKGYSVSVTFADDQGSDSTNVDLSYFYSQDFFNEAYAYTGDDLGVTLDNNSTTFKVWSPFSRSLKVRVYETGTPASLGGSDEYNEYSMYLGEKGVYETTVNENLAGKYYTYVVTNSSYTNKEVVDPYARSAGVNGDRGMIIDLSTTDPEGWDDFEPLQYDRKELTVYETHIADLTSSSTWNGTSTAKTYAAFHEEGTTYTQDGTAVSTGFDHIKELGVNAVQILPFFDQDNDEVNVSFNWGYNPLNYNVPEGCYSSNPYDGATRVTELKELIMAYGKEGISIIMDVVYNHVMNANGCNFDVLVPGYYFRYTSSGTLSNGSGCGNETASEHYMFSKFMVDSASYWAKEYKLGGFRFDLMGLHDLDTMAAVVEACEEVNPYIVIYGEPWQGGTSTLSSSVAATQANVAKYQGYGQFNDGMRDALIKGGLNAATAKGWATNYSASSSLPVAISYGIKGGTYSSGTTTDPDKTVNYVTCHDNYTLYDRIDYLYPSGDEHHDDITKMACLAEAVVFTSQGTTFMLAGDEFGRSKQGNDNSYNASYQVNELDYSLKITNADLFENLKKLIAFKQNTDALHLSQSDATSIEVGGDATYVIYDISDGTNSYRIAHAAPCCSGTTIDLDGYSIYLDTLNSGVTPSSSTALSAMGTIIAYK